MSMWLLRKHFANGSKGKVLDRRFPFDFRLEMLCSYENHVDMNRVQHLLVPHKVRDLLKKRFQVQHGRTRHLGFFDRGVHQF